MRQYMVIASIFLLFGTFVGLRHTTVLAQDDDGGNGWDTRGQDGHYHNPSTGEIMDDSCNMHHDNPHPCHCNRANPDANCDPNKPDTEKPSPGEKCRTYCRNNDCHCQPDCAS